MSQVRVKRRRDDEDTRVLDDVPVCGVEIDPNCGLYRRSTVVPSEAHLTLGKQFEWNSGTNPTWPIVTFASTFYVAFTSQAPPGTPAIPHTDIAYMVLAHLGLPFRLLYGPTVVIGRTPDGATRSFTPDEYSLTMDIYHKRMNQTGPPQGAAGNKLPRAAIITPQRGIYGVLCFTPTTLAQQVQDLLHTSNVTVLISERYRGYTIAVGDTPVPADDVAHAILDRLGFYPRTLYGPVVVVDSEDDGLLPDDLDFLNSLYSSRT